jgi:hypothetical protein
MPGEGAWQRPVPLGTGWSEGLSDAEPIVRLRTPEANLLGDTHHSVSPGSSGVHFPGPAAAGPGYHHPVPSGQNPASAVRKIRSTPLRMGLSTTGTRTNRVQMLTADPLKPHLRAVDLGPTLDEELL